MRAAIVLFLGIAAVSASPLTSNRIVGGSETTIEQYPSQVATIVSWFGVEPFLQSCAGTIITNRVIVSAAHCYWLASMPWQWRIRAGSSYASSGGSVYTVQRILDHPDYNLWSHDMDISIIRINGAFTWSEVIKPSSIPSPNYHLADNEEVWAIGWGALCFQCPNSEVLRHVQVWTVNQEVCKERYAPEGYVVTENMLCSGWLDVGGRDQCQGDSGGPLFHNGVLVGVCSFGHECALGTHPGVNARVSVATNWIVANL